MILFGYDEIRRQEESIRLLEKDLVRQYKRPDHLLRLNEAHELRCAKPYTGRYHDVRDVPDSGVGFNGLLVESLDEVISRQVAGRNDTFHLEIRGSFEFPKFQ